ncbi:MAG: GH32 C-terminal domain-containing protein [Paenibacillaceae bacterium]|nr:GH32 C-terminal domain-containing protein [Paenibacillaceae bacterium]
MKRRLVFLGIGLLAAAAVCGIANALLRQAPSITEDANGVSAAERESSGSSPAAVKRTLLHYRPEAFAMGDVHPFYENGTYYLYYLKPNTYESLLAVSDDMINWSERKLTHGGLAPFAAYYVLGVFKDGGLYRSYYGSQHRMKGSESADLLHWTNADFTYDIPGDVQTYPAGTRDPYVFHDPDIASYRMVATAYRTKEKSGIGSGLDAAIVLSTARSGDLTDWGPPVDLVRFPNRDVPLAKARDPEVAQMARIGDRWYLLASIAGQSVHHVGKPTYWVGEAGTPIDRDDWESKPAHSLDGEDLDAAQLFPSGDRWLLLGWIPQQAEGNAWGGHLSFPREIVPLADGTLASRLEPAFGAAIRGRLLYGAASSAKIAAETGDWRIGPASASLHGTGSGTARLPGTYDRADVELEVTTSPTVSRAGLAIESRRTGSAEAEAVYVTLDRTNRSIRVSKERDGAGNGTVYSEIAVSPEAFDAAGKLRVAMEGDMLEIFLNDRYSLAARIPFALSVANIGIFASAGGAEFNNVRVYDLNAPRN